MRLEGLFISLGLNPDEGFYSKLVRLEGYDPVLFWHTGHTFLFQTGAIRSEIPIYGRPRTSTFLFQTGAIRSLDDLFNEDGRFQFLFQTGAIRRIFFTIKLIYCQLCFYSKLVRLEVYARKSEKVHKHLCFYSKLVRLEAREVVCCDTRKRLCFYSKLVRLEVMFKPNTFNCFVVVSIPNWCD